MSIMDTIDIHVPPAARPYHVQVSRVVDVVPQVYIDASGNKVERCVNYEYLVYDRSGKIITETSSHVTKSVDFIV